MRLSDLLKGVKIKNTRICLEENITKPFSDSRKLFENGVFIAIKGSKRDGNDYIEQILSQGVKCVITDSEEAFCKYENTILVKNSREALSYIWDNYYENPTKNMKIVAITGTNGKTSSAYYMYNILKSANKTRLLISTIEVLINDIPYDVNGGSDVSDIHSAMTTPDPEKLFEIFDKARAEGVEYAVMEASSHALEQFKLSPLSIEIGVFTNLSLEHLDFHKNMREYFESKRKLFDISRHTVINIDDKYGKKLSKTIKSPRSLCGIENIADYYASNINYFEDGFEYVLNCKQEAILIKGNIKGEFSVYNSMLAIACAKELGVDTNAIKNGIFNTKSIKGRLEKVANENIIIDYAHTPYAMKNVISSFKKTSLGRIIVLFGCGGDRDKEKRKKMGEIASEMADMIIVTSDNPRSENSISIIRDILKGISPKSDLIVIPNRRKAIITALKEKNRDDTLLILGKGHENYEIREDGKHYFNEKEIIESVLKNESKNQTNNNQGSC